MSNRWLTVSSVCKSRLCTCRHPSTWNMSSIQKSLMKISLLLFQYWVYWLVCTLVYRWVTLCGNVYDKEVMQWVYDSFNAGTSYDSYQSGTYLALCLYSNAIVPYCKYFWQQKLCMLRFLILELSPHEYTKPKIIAIICKIFKQWLRDIY